jgi:hypothetical protein
MKPILLLSFLTIACLKFYAQEEPIKCGFERVLQKISSYKAKIDSTQNLITQTLEKNKHQRKEEDTVTYIIPVVVHILHKGEPYGEGLNIPDEQVYAQIDVLNEDFNRLNIDTTNTPSFYKNIAGKLKIKFCLAKIDPNCEFTNGITRQKAIKKNNLGEIVGFTLDDDKLIKSHNIWPTDQYLNIWVCDLVEYVGYATFPFLPQLNLTDPENSTYDGIVIQTTAFGRNYPNTNFNLKKNYNKGRTTTHEVGHWLGLLHTWGNVDCSNQLSCVCGDDYCDDTPPTDGPLTRCVNKISNCSDTPTRVMRENYMDYTPDNCMNLFTLDQIARMKTVLNINERRQRILRNNLCSAKLPSSFDVPITDSLHEGNVSEILWYNPHKLKPVYNPFTNNWSLDFSDTSVIISNHFKNNIQMPLYLDVELYTDNSPLLEIYFSQKCGMNWEKKAILNWSNNQFIGAQKFKLSPNHYRISIPIPPYNGFTRFMIKNSDLNEKVYIEKVKLCYHKSSFKLLYNTENQPFLQYELTQPNHTEISIYDLFGNVMLKKIFLLTNKGIVNYHELNLNYISKGIYLLSVKTENSYEIFKLINS